MFLSRLADFLNNELKNKYEVNWRYDHSTNSIVVEMRDGLLRHTKYISINDICMRKQSYYESSMVVLLRDMMQHIDKYREEERKRLEKKNE